MVRKSVLFGNVIVDIAFPHRSFVFSQSGCEVSATLTDVGGVLLSVRDLPSGLLTLHATPLFFNMSDSEEARARSSRNDGVLDPSVGAAIQSAVSESMDSLTDNLTKVTY